MKKDSLVNEETAKEKEIEVVKPFKNRKRILVSIAGIAILLAVVVGICIYNVPENRLSRHLKMANKYLLTMEYERAIVEFDKAIEIDSMCMEAYQGKAEVYVDLNDYNQAVKTLEAGYLAVQEDNEEVLEGIGKCLEQYLSELIEEGKIDEAQANIEEYRYILSGTDFDTYMNQMEIEMKEMKYAALLSEVQERIIAEEYDQVTELVKGPEFQDMTASLQVDQSYYVGERNQNGERSGLGTAVYSGYYGSYYYYGSWIQGKKSGYGKAIFPDSSSPDIPYTVFVGEWANDLPNGEGEEKCHIILSELEDGSSILYSLYRGTFKDGLCDGEIYTEETYADEIVGYWGTAKSGVWQGETDGGGVYALTRVDDGTQLWESAEYNKDHGVLWLLPSSYWEEE